MRNAILWVILFVALSSFSAAHKFYVSVTQVEYSEKDASLQIISRIFVDDMEATLEERYGITARLGTPEESGLAKEYVSRYFQTKFNVEVNGEEREVEFLGYRFDKDLLVCYLEVSGIPSESLRSVGVRNDLLTDMFEEQKNLVHLRILGQRKSLVLIRENNKGMLNL